MRFYLLLFLYLFLSACGGGGSKAPNSQPSNQNKAPEVSISGVSEARSLQTIRLNTVITEPEGESVTIKWTSEDDGVTFTDTSLNGVLVKVPAVAQDKQISVTVVVTDSANNTARESFSILVKAIVIIANIDLPDSYEFLSSNTVKVNAKFSSNDYIDSIDWQLDGLSVSGMEILTEITNSSGESSVIFSAPMVEESLTFTLTMVLNTVAGEAKKATQVTIIPNDEKVLVVNLDAQYEVNENDQFLIKPNILTNDRLISYQWYWKEKELGELVGVTNQNLAIKTSEVDENSRAKLVLEVETESGIKKIAETDIVVKNIANSGGVSLTINRLYAAPGQEVIAQVDLANESDIKEYEWQIDENVFTQSTQNSTQLSIIMPEQDAYSFDTLVKYKVTFKDDVTVDKSVYFTLLNESATKQLLNIEKPDEVPQLYKDETLTFNLKAIDRAGLLDTVSLDVPDSRYAEFDTAKLIQDGLDLSFILKASDILLDKELMLRVVMNAGTVSTTEYVSVNLNKSNLKLFAGSEKTYISGSDFYVFGYGQERLNNPINAMSWSTNYDDLAIETLNSTDAKITNETTSSFPTVTLSARDSEGQLIQADVRTNMTSHIYDKGERYTCYFRANEVLCRDNSNTLLDVGELDAPVKAGVTKGEFVCLLKNDDQLSCHGERPLSVLEVPERAGVANIVAVSNSDMCAQYNSGNWHCWGEQADYFNNLFVGKSHIDNLIGTQQGVCLVNSGYIECYNDKSELIYQDKRSFVNSLDFVNILNKVCYTTERSTLRTCPDEIN